MLDSLARFFAISTAGFASFLEREAGYHVISLGLIVVGVCLVDPQTRPQIAHDLVVFATGVMARSMSGKLGAPQPPKA